MIPFNTWVKGLIASCAKIRESNVFANVNTFQKSPVIQGTIDTSQSPQNGNNGIVSAITFADNNNATVGSVCATYSNTEAKGMYFKTGQGKLGLEKTDEGEYVTHSPEPKDGAGNDQIVTTGYLLDCISELDIDSLLRRLVDLENQLTALTDNLMSYIPTVDQAITYNSLNPVTSKAIFNFVTNLYNGLQQQIEDKVQRALRNALENNITSVNFGTPREITVSSDTLTYTPTEPGLMIIKFYRKGGKSCTWYVNNVEKSVSGGGDGTVQQTYPCKADVAYKWVCGGGVQQALWVPLTFSIGEA
jgi:hypothetical protein